MGNLKDQARLARAEGRAQDGVMSARLDENGNMVIGPATRPAEVTEMLAGNSAEQKAEELGYDEDMTEGELDERTEALQALITSKMRWERKQIVAVVEAYAQDCQQRARYIAVDEPRRGAFKVRAAIALDLAGKIRDGWGRDVDGKAT